MPADHLLVALSVAPSDEGMSPCDLIPGPVGAACKGGEVAGSAAGGFADFAGDPIGAIAEKFAEAAAFFIGKLGDLITATTQVDVANPHFLRQYGIVFGASTFFVLVVALAAIAKNVIRGRAVEAAKSTTLNMLYAVLAAAFAPAVMYLMLQVTDRLTEGLMFGAADDGKRFLEGTAKALLTLNGPTTGFTGGSMTAMVLSLLGVVAAGLLWLELLLRSAALYICLGLAPLIFSGLVDKALWPRVRRFLSFTLTVLMAKPIIGLVLAIATSLLAGGNSGDAFASVSIGLATLFLALFATGLLFKLIPAYGDDIAHAVDARRQAANAGPAAAMPGPATVVHSSVQRHLVSNGSRMGGAKAASAAGGAATGGAMTVATGAQRAASGATKTATRTTKQATDSVNPQQNRERGT